ncbi:GNAT family N-acetyltransferase [Halobacillus kuroshimensis]|uniref:GNAT family N-acetyltransferase n=1 Tax=Halobacillus kuroshimensis TaxID=302481 RepID=A0ABS3DTY7_9BACI|nr:GNAT family N-acetyltransferase [Halobacillus kuroshimensis]MBN8234794.1 GNAT family N-acetyltransferase [Halobacillus kuroshimensis]
MDPIHIDVPYVLHTKRLCLRRPEAGDGPAINEAVHRSEQELKPWLPFVQEMPSVEDTESNVRQAHADFMERKKLRYLVFRKENGEFVGSTGLHNIDWDIPKFEIGYWIDTKWSGHGYMQEAVREITRLALYDLGGARVEIRCERENEKSRQVPEKLGYHFEGMLCNDDRSVDGKHLTDTCVYAKIKERRQKHV